MQVYTDWCWRLPVLSAVRVHYRWHAVHGTLQNLAPTEPASTPLQNRDVKTGLSIGRLWRLERSEFL